MISPRLSQENDTLIASLTDAVASAFGEQARAGVTVELVATPAGRTGVGGVLTE